MLNNSLKTWLIKNRIPFITDFNLKEKSWLKAGGIIDLFIRPLSIEDCKLLIKKLKFENYKYLILGNISNVIIRDGIIKTPVINLNNLKKVCITDLGDNYNIVADAGLSVTSFVKRVSEKGISGFEGLIGVPGSLGGAICMNASSYGSCISDYLSKVEAIDPNGEPKVLLKEKINFGWRTSSFLLSKFLVIKCYFSLEKKNIKSLIQIRDKISETINHRKHYQEKKFPNLGSLYATKNIYYDLRKKNIIYFVLYYSQKIFTLLFYKINKSNILNIRSFYTKIYYNLIAPKKNYGYGFSQRTINCLVNLSSSSGNDAINFVREVDKKIGKFSRLENIILEDID